MSEPLDLDAIRERNDAWPIKSVTALLAEVERLTAERDRFRAAAVRIREARRRLSSRLIASAHLLDVPFTDAPDHSPWTGVKAALYALDAAVDAYVAGQVEVPPTPTTDAEIEALPRLDLGAFVSIAEQSRQMAVEVVELTRERNQLRAVVEKVRALIDEQCDGNHRPDDASPCPAGDLVHALRDALSATQTPGADTDTAEAAQDAASGRTDTAEGDETHEAVPDAPRGAEAVLPCSRCGSNPVAKPGDRRRNGAVSAFARYCADCIDRCHESTDFAHECVICADPTEATP